MTTLKNEDIIPAAPDDDTELSNLSKIIKAQIDQLGLSLISETIRSYTNDYWKISPTDLSQKHIVVGTLCTSFSRLVHGDMTNIEYYETLKRIFTNRSALNPGIENKITKIKIQFSQLLTNIGTWIVLFESQHLP